MSELATLKAPPAFGETSENEARQHIASLPGQTIYEARFALQQLRESDLPHDEQVEIIEPLARCLGWTEALVFATETMKQQDTVRAIVGANGYRTPS